MDVDLSGRVVMVTGGARAIGTAVVTKFSENGASVVVADVNEPGAKALADTLARALALSFDIRDEAAARHAVETVVERSGRLDVLVNDAGVNTFKDRVDIDAFPPEEWRRVVSIDFEGLDLMSMAAVIHLTRSMALELGPKGILVNSTAPRSVMTEGTRKLFYDEDGSFRAQTERSSATSHSAAWRASRKSPKACCSCRRPKIRA